MENEIYNWNPFIKGYISEEDCGKKLRYEYYEYVFEASTIDLRDRLITITFDKNLFGNEAPKLSSYTLALGIFMAEYERYIRQHLNGFCGWDCIKFQFFGFGYIRLD